MAAGIEVQELSLQKPQVVHVSGDARGCVLLLDDKAFALEHDVAIELAWKLCSLLQHVNGSADGDHSPDARLTHAG